MNGWESHECERLWAKICPDYHAGRIVFRALVNKGSEI